MKSSRSTLLSGFTALLLAGCGGIHSAREPLAGSAIEHVADQEEGAWIATTPADGVLVRCIVREDGHMARCEPRFRGARVNEAMEVAAVAQAGKTVVRPRLRDGKPVAYPARLRIVPKGSPSRLDPGSHCGGSWRSCYRCAVAPHGALYSCITLHQGENVSDEKRVRDLEHLKDCRAAPRDARGRPVHWVILSIDH